MKKQEFITKWTAKAEVYKDDLICHVIKKIITPYELKDEKELIKDYTQMRIFDYKGRLRHENSYYHKCEKTISLIEFRIDLLTELLNDLT